MKRTLVKLIFPTDGTIFDLRYSMGKVCVKKL
jgi:hypothetical protein